MIFPPEIRKWVTVLVCTAWAICGLPVDAAGQPGRAPSDTASGLAASQAELSETEVRVRRLFIRGLSRAELNDYQTAVDLLSEALELAPHEAAIASALASSYQALENTPSALYYAREAVAREPGNPFYQLQLAHLYRVSADVDQAVIAYRTALDLAPRNEQALIELAQILAASGDFRSAVETYQRLNDIRGETRDVREQMLNLYTFLADSAGVRQTLETLVQIEPGDLKWRRRLARLYLDQQKRGEAVRLFEEVVSADPSNIEAARLLTELRQKPVRVDGAATPQSSADSTSTSPPVAQKEETAGNSSEPLLVQAPAESVGRDSPLPGSALANKKRADTKADELARLLESDPRDLGLWARTADAYRRAGALEQADSIVQEGLFLFPGQPVLLNISAALLLDAGRFNEAATRLEEALAILAEDNPDDEALKSTLVAGLARTYNGSGQHERSDSLYSRALELDSQNALARSSFALSLAQRGRDLDRVLTLAREAISLAPHEPAHMHALGSIYLLRGDIREASVWLEKAIEVGSIDPRAFEQLGDACQHLGEIDRAQHFWQEALHLDPNNNTLIEKLN